MGQDRKSVFFVAVVLVCLFYILHVSRFIYTSNEFLKKESEACSSQLTISETVNEHKQNSFLPPNYATLKTMTKPELLDIYWRYINSLQVLCRNQTRLGSMKDGGKEVCVDDLYKPRQPCLVYSFGSNFRFDFEKSVLRHYRCEVHTFDPSKQIGHRRIPRGVSFHLVGLWNSSTTNGKGWKMKTLLSIRKELNHTNRVIDLLKIDIEGGEWPAFLEMIQSGVLKKVKQICVEIHFVNDMARQLTILRRLYEQGFHIFMHEHNLFSVTHSKNLKQSITVINEISLINVNWKEVRNSSK